MNRISKSFAVIFILIIAISGLSLLMVKPANADPMPKPAIFPMTITILSPTYGQQINGNDFLLNFSITDIPNSEIRMYVSNKDIRFNGWVWIYLDGNETNTFPEYPLSLEVIETQPTLSYSFNLTGAPEGEHTISVKVSCSSQYHINLNGMSVPTKVSVNSITPTTQPNRNAPHLDPIVYLISVSVMVAVVLSAGLLVYHKKHKGSLVKKV